MERVRFKPYMKEYNCGAVTIVREEKPITPRVQQRCFGYLRKGKCAALTEVLCETTGKCAFWREASKVEESEANS